MRFRTIHNSVNIFLAWSILIGLPDITFCQDIFPDSLPTAQWERSGVHGSIPSFDQIINIVDEGADPNGNNSNTAILNQLLQEYSGTETVIYFPEGNYLFSEPVHIQDQIILRGEGQGRTNLIFDLKGQGQHAITIKGSISTEAFPILGNIEQGSLQVSITDLELPNNESFWAYLQFNDSSLMASSWAYQTAGGLYELSPKGGNDFLSEEAFRRTILTEDNPEVRLITPITSVGLECLSITRLDATEQQTSNILFDADVDCWIVGVESKFCNFAHVDIRRSANVIIRGNYFQEAHAYGGGGQGYGVVLQYGTSLCLVENNIFRKLRHSMLLQAGAQANALAYNYSREAYWTQGGMPSDAAGDLVLHGNYSFLNLFEGNIVQNIVIDASHGKNGPHNYFLRNRAELYGIFMSPGSGTDSTHFIGNEVISNTFLQGFYSLIGVGNFEYGNRVRGLIKPEGTDGALPESLYSYQKPGFWDDGYWPHIGVDDLALSAVNPAKVRYDLSEYTDCRINPVSSTSSIESNTSPYSTLKIYPNPAANEIFVDESLSNEVTGLIYSVSGKLMKSMGTINTNSPINISSLPAGSYVLVLIDQRTFHYRAFFVKQ